MTSVGVAGVAPQDDGLDDRPRPLPEREHRGPGGVPEEDGRVAIGRVHPPAAARPPG